MVAEVSAEEKDYFEKAVLPLLKPISGEEYVNGFWAVLQTMAKYIYLLSETEMYWVTMWEGGLLTLTINPEGEMKAALTQAWEEEEWIEPAYRLFYRGWDAQFEEEKRKWIGFKKANAHQRELYQSYLDLLNQYTDTIQKNQATRANYVEDCLDNLRLWTLHHFNR